MSDDAHLQQKLARMETLIEQARKLEDPVVRGEIQELVQHLLDFHGAALTAMVDQVRQTGPVGRAILDAWTRDELVASLLMLYGLHPVDMEIRVREALERAAEELRTFGVEVTLLGIEEGAVRLHIENVQNNSNGHSSASIAVRRRIAKAIYDAAPDVAGITTDAAAMNTQIEFVRLTPLKAV